MPIVGGGSIIPGDGGIAPTTDDTRGGGGGGSNEPTYDRDYVVNPLEIAPLDQTATVQFTNSGDTPIAVEMTFENSHLRGIGFDDGTPQNPVYAIAAQDAITVAFERDQAVSSDPATGQTNDTITVTTTAGDLASVITARVFQPATVHGTVQSILTAETPTGQPALTPSLEYRFANASNSGSAGSTYDLNFQRKITFNASTTEYTGFTGYTQWDGVFRRREAAAVTDLGLADDPYDIFAHPATAIIAMSPFEYSSGSGETFISGALNRPFSLTKAASNSATSAPAIAVTTSTGSVSTVLGTSYNNTEQSSSEQIAFRTASGFLDEPFIIAVTNTGTDLIVRWKQKGHGAGFSYRNVGAPGDPGNTTDRLHVVGDQDPYRRSAGSTRFLYWAFIPHALTDAEFLSITQAAVM